MKITGNILFKLMSFLFCFVFGVYFLITDISKTEEEIYKDTHNNGKHSKGLAAMQIQENFGKTGIIVFHSIICFGVALVSGYSFFSELSKERKAPQNEKTAEMVISEIMEMFEEKRTVKSSEISERLEMSELEIIGYLIALVVAGKIVEVGEDEYKKCEEEKID